MAFRDMWKEFFEKLTKIYQEKIKARPDILSEDAINLLSRVSTRLGEPDVLEAVDKAIREEREADEKNEASISFLEEELKLFITSVKEDFDKSRYRHTVDARLAQAKTIKDSLNTLPLPGWLKKILGILNELIDLAKVARP